MNNKTFSDYLEDEGEQNKEVKLSKEVTVRELKEALNKFDDDSVVLMYLDEEGSPVKSLEAYESAEDVEDNLYNKSEWDIRTSKKLVVLVGNQY